MGFKEVSDVVSWKSNPLSISRTVFSSWFHVCLPGKADSIKEFLTQVGDIGSFLGKGIYTAHHSSRRLLLPKRLRTRIPRFFRPSEPSKRLSTCQYSDAFIEPMNEQMNEPRKRKEQTKQTMRESRIESISESEGNRILVLILFITLEENQQPGRRPSLQGAVL